MGHEVRALIEPFIKQLFRHSHLRNTDREALLSLSGRAETVRMHREALHLGEQTSTVMLLVTGFLGKFHETGSGGRQIVSLYVPGDIANLHSVLSVEGDTGIVALSNATVVRLPKDDLSRLAAQSAPIAQALWRECAAEAARSTRWLLNLGRRSATATVAHLFCEVATRTSRQVPPADGRIPFAVTQADIADMAGCSLVHANRTLRGLRAAGLLEQGPGGFTILDWDGLRREAGFDPGYLGVDARLQIAA